MIRRLVASVAAVPPTIVGPAGLPTRGAEQTSVAGFGAYRNLLGQSHELRCRKAHPTAEAIVRRLSARAN